MHALIYERQRNDCIWNEIDRTARLEDAISSSIWCYFVVYGLFGSLAPAMHLEIFPKWKKVQEFLGAATARHGAEVSQELFVRSVFESATCLPLSKFLIATPDTLTLALGSNTLIKKRFPDFDFPSDDVCRHTYLSGDGYFTPPEVYRSARRHIPIVDHFQSIVALNMHQANSAFVCLKVRNVQRCEVQRVELALGQRGSDCADPGLTFVLTDSNHSEVSHYSPIMSIPMIRNYTQGAHVRTVLVLSCSLLDASKMGRYWEVDCPHQYPARRSAHVYSFVLAVYLCS
jgi:hypothetical protein